MCLCPLQVQLLPISKIAVADLGGKDWLSIYQGPGLSTSWNSLRAGCKYQLHVACRNAVGYSQYSVPVIFVTAPDAPLPPPRPSALVESRVSSAHTHTHLHLFQGTCLLPMLYHMCHCTDTGQVGYLRALPILVHPSMLC
jgi:hypothetical protein